MKWESLEKNKENQEHYVKMSEKFNVPIYLIKLLENRGVVKEKDIEIFLNPKVKHLHNPFLMRDMKKAVNRIVEAIQKGEKILGYADYDCDGVTTAAMMKIGFRMLGVEIDVYAPNRYSDGYGLNEKKMEEFCKKYDVILSGDTGIRNFESGVIAKKHNVDLIITDHHEPWIRKADDNEEQPKGSVVEYLDGEKIALPDAYAVIDPKRLGDIYPGKGLAGVSIIFKLMLALFSKMKKDMKELIYYVDLVSVGCIADLAPQIYKNEKNKEIDLEVRTLSKLGIAVMNGKKQKLWMQSVREVVGIEDKKIESSDIGFKIGPMFNAPGRMDDPKPAVDFIIETEPKKSLLLAQKLRQYNADRKKITDNTKERIILELKNKGEEYYQYGIVAKSPEIEGISGIIAGKVLENFYRPTIVFAQSVEDPKKLKGSARSIKGVHVLRQLEKVERKIGAYMYGGHEQAAGMTIEKSQLEEFQKNFIEACKDIDETVFTRRVEYEFELEIKEVNLDFLEKLNLLKPYGMENAEPKFRSNYLEIVNPKLHENGPGIGFFVKAENGVRYRAVSFESGEEIIEIYKKEIKEHGKCCVDIVYEPLLNEWKDVISVQIKVIDVKPSKI